MTNQLWTDQYIDECFEHEDDFSYARQMRDDYESRVATLEAQLATTWQPVADGVVITCACGEPSCTNNHTVTSGGQLLSGGTIVDLGRLRVCKSGAL